MASLAGGSDSSELSGGHETPGIFDDLAQAIADAMSSKEQSSHTPASNLVDLTLESSANTSLLALTAAGTEAEETALCLASSRSSEPAIKVRSQVAPQIQAVPLARRYQSITSDSVTNRHSDLAPGDPNQTLQCALAAPSVIIATSAQPTPLAYQSIGLLSQTGAQFEHLEPDDSATSPCFLAPDLDFTNGNADGSLIPGLNCQLKAPVVNQTDESPASVQYRFQETTKPSRTDLDNVTLNQTASLGLPSSSQLRIFSSSVRPTSAAPVTFSRPPLQVADQYPTKLQSQPATFDPRGETNYAHLWPQSNKIYQHRFSGSGSLQFTTPAQSPQFSVGPSSPSLWSPAGFQTPRFDRQGSAFNPFSTSGYSTRALDSCARSSRLTKGNTLEEDRRPRRHRCSHTKSRVSKHTIHTRLQPAGTGPGTKLVHSTVDDQSLHTLQARSDTRNASIDKRDSQVTTSAKDLMEHCIGQYQRGDRNSSQASFPFHLQTPGYGHFGSQEVQPAQFPQGTSGVSSNQLVLPPAARNQVLETHPGVMNPRKRGRVVSTAEAYPVEKYARGASPTRYLASRPAPVAPQEYNYSFPTVPNVQHFGDMVPPKLETRVSIGSFPGHNAFRPGYEDVMQADHKSTTTFDQESIITSPTHISHPGSSQLNADFRSDEWSAINHFDEAWWDNCSKGCDDASCSVEQCISCHSGCSDDCSDPDRCSSATCRNPSCLPSPQPALLDDQGSSQHPIGQPFNAVYDCDWVGNGVNCEHSRADPDQLRQHVIESHIIPQRNRVCQWNGCTATVDVQDLKRHVFEDHRADQTTERFGCLWEQCDEKFTSADDLDVHFKYAHCNDRPECHSGGCDVVTMSEVELRNHIFEAHMNMSAFEADAVKDTPMSNYSADQPGSEPYQSSIDPEENHVGESASPPGALSDQLAELMGKRKSDVLGEKQCMWTTHGMICGRLFDNGNDLHEHIKNTHGRAPDTPNPHDLRCEWLDCDYIESTKDRSKLWRHLATHTKYALAACGCHGKEFADKHRLDDHLRKSTRDRPFICDTCGSFFSHVHALTIHKRTHTGEKPLKCNQCDYSCGDPSNMSKHRKTHIEPQYECLTCHKKFGRKETLKRHLNIHNPDKETKRRKPGPKPGK